MLSWLFPRSWLYILLYQIKLQQIKYDIILVVQSVLQWKFWLIKIECSVDVKIDLTRLSVQ